MISKQASNVLWKEQKKLIIGWREWIALPALGLESIKAKIDTGARTSSLHASDLETFDEDGVVYARFHALSGKSRLQDSPAVMCVAPLLDQRKVRSSNGHSEERYVVETVLRMGGESWPIELTLTSREQMGFHMLIGRNALRNRCLVDPNLSFKTGYVFAHASSDESGETDSK